MPTSQTTDKIFEKELFLLEKLVPGGNPGDFKIFSRRKSNNQKGFKKAFLGCF
jgi:hypothetical protein